MAADRMSRDELLEFVRQLPEKNDSSKHVSSRSFKQAIMD